MGHVSISLDEMGLDEMELDEMGLDEMWLDEMERHQGDVDGGTFFRSPKTGIHVMSCMVFFRSPKTGMHVMSCMVFWRIIADLRKGVYYQKCYDPKCRRIDFRSSGTYCPC